MFRSYSSSSISAIASKTDYFSGKNRCDIAFVTTNNGQLSFDTAFNTDGLELSELNSIVKKYNKKVKKYTKKCSYITDNNKSTCETIKKERETKQNQLLRELSKLAKDKAEAKLGKLTKKVKTKRLKNFNCYLKLLLDLLNKSECKKSSSGDSSSLTSSNYSVDKLIDMFGAEYNNDPDKTNIALAKSYITKLLKDSDILTDKETFKSLKDKYGQKLIDFIKNKLPTCSN